MSTPITISVDPRTGSVAVRGSVWEHATAWHDLKRLLDRLLAIPEISAVKVDRWRGVAVVNVARPSHDAAWIGWPQLVRKIAAGMRHQADRAPFSDAYGALGSIQLSKVTSDIVGGTVYSSTQRRTRLRHPLLKGAPSLEAIVRPLLANHAGIRSVQVSTTTGTLLIQHAATVTPPQLLIALERAILRAGRVTVNHGSTSRLLRSGGCLGLAAVAEVFVPGLVPLAAGALVVNNLPTLGRGARELVTFRWRLPALYTVIMGTTLVSGQVLAAAIMQLSIVGWYWWSNRRLRHMVDDLLSAGTLNHVAESSRLTSAALMDVPLNGDALPGNPAARETSAPDHSNLLPLRSHAACDALIASLARLTSENDPTPRGHDRAARFVPLTFATGAAAALTTDIATLAAVLRPDFATGPSIAERLSMAVGVRQLMDRGWLVLRPEVLPRLMTIDAVVLLETSAGSRSATSAESVVVPRRDIPVLAASRQRWKLRTARATVDVHRVSGAPQALQAYVRQLIDSGEQLAVCGSSDLLREFAPDAMIRIADDHDRFDESCVGDIVALPGCCEMPELWDTLIRETNSTNGVWPVVLTCNLAAILGAFAIGLTSLHVVVLTNLGTWAAYSYFNERFNRRSTGLPAAIGPSDGGPANSKRVIEVQAATSAPASAGAEAVAC